MTREKGKPTVPYVPFFRNLRLTKKWTTTIVLLGFATVCFAASPREDAPADTGKPVSLAGEPVSPGRPGIAPNQSASLEDSQTLTAGVASDDRDTDRMADEGEVSSAVRASTEMHEVRGVTPPDEVAAQSAAPVGRRVPRVAESSMRSVATLPDVPWYRTGLGALSIVLVVIAVVVWCIRRWMPRFGGAGCSVLNVVGRVGLSPKHSVALVSLGRRFVLVGLSGDRMTRICEVSDPQEVADLTLRLGVTSSSGESLIPGGKSNAFESLLDGEVNEYASAGKPANKEVSRTGEVRGGAAREPLSALLKRLRSLQVK